MFLLNLNPIQTNLENRFRKNLQHDRPLVSYHQVALFSAELIILRKATMVIQAWLILIKKPFESHDASKRFLPFVQDTFASKIIRNSDYFSDF